MKRRLLLMALASIPVIAVAARVPKRGAGKPGGPLDPRHRDDEKQDQAPTKAPEEEKRPAEKSEESSQKESSD